MPMVNDLKNHFKDYNDTKDILEELEYKMMQLESEMYNVKAVKYSITPSGSGLYNDNKPFQIVKKDKLVEQIDIIRKEVERLEKKYIKEIYCINDGKLRRVLRLIYLQGMDVEEIAEMMQYTSNHVYKLKKKAEEEFRKIIQKNN